MQQVYIYTRAICKRQFKSKCCYAVALVRYKNNQKILFYKEQHITTNRIMLKIILQAMYKIKEPSNIEIYTSSSIDFKFRGNLDKDLVLIISDIVLENRHSYRVTTNNVRQEQLDKLLKEYYALKVAKPRKS